jgi:hypothetical protein
MLIRIGRKLIDTQQHSLSSTLSVCLCVSVYVRFDTEDAQKCTKNAIREDTRFIHAHTYKHTYTDQCCAHAVSRDPSSRTYA